MKHGSARAQGLVCFPKAILDLTEIEIGLLREPTLGALHAPLNNLLTHLYDVVAHPHMVGNQHGHQT